VTRLVEALKLAVALGVVGMLLLVLGAIVRFSIVSSVRTRGARGRLRRPDPAGVASICGFAPPPELVELFARAPYVERMEFALVDSALQRRWTIGEFIPLTKRDVSEARVVHGVSDGIPIADDGDKGAYIVLPNGAVIFRSPSASGGESIVAESVEALRSFKPLSRRVRAR